VVFIDTRTGSERTVDVGPPLPGVSLAWLDEATLILSLLDRSSAPMQLWLLSYPQGSFTRLTNDPSQYVGLTLTADRSRLATARSEASFSIWTSADRWCGAAPAHPLPRGRSANLDGAFAADGRLAIGRASIKNNIVLFRGLKKPAN
jgi:hypothetical protein